MRGTARAISSLITIPIRIGNGEGFEVQAAGSPLERIARNSGRELLLDTTSWIHRRVERVRYTDSETLKWHFSVDFTIKESFEPFESHQDGSSTYFLPLALLRKWPPLMNLDIRDELNRPLPLLTSEKNRRVDAAALASLVAKKPDSAIAMDLLEGIATATSVQGAESLLDKFAKHVEEDILPRLQTPEDADDWRRIALLSTNFAWNSLLWARVRGDVEQRQLVKVSFERLIPPTGPLLLRLPSTFGLTGEWIRLDLHNLGERESYHLEFLPPRGTDVLEARLQVLDPLTRPSKPPWYRFKQRLHRQQERRRRRDGYTGDATTRRFGRRLSDSEPSPLPMKGTAYSLNMVSRAHFYIAESAGQRGKALVRLGPTRREFLTGALYAAVLTTALLWFSYIFADKLVEKNHEGPTVTALLLLPALLSYLFTQPLPHPIARRMIAGVRVVTRTVTLLPVIAALIMLGLTAASGTGNPDIALIEAWWLRLAIAASGLTILLAITAKVLPRAATGELYAPIED